jgi:dihydroorotase
MLGKPLIQHCEDADLAGGGCINNGRTSLRMGLPGIPPMAEEIMIQRDLLLAQNTKSHYHVAHISTAGSVQLVREAKARGIKVTAEVCPHHLLLTDECTESYDTNYKMNPPLRSQKDVDACIQGLVDGTIDCLVTDHAPHGREGKELDFQSAPFGIVGLEVALGLLAKALIAPGHLDWPELIAKLTINPARILDIPKGSLRGGADADVTIIDPSDNWIVDVRQFKSRSQNCPYDGWPLPARVSQTIVHGKPKFICDSNIAMSGSRRGA